MMNLPESERGLLILACRFFAEQCATDAAIFADSKNPAHSRTADAFKQQRVRLLRLADRIEQAQEVQVRPSLDCEHGIPLTRILSCEPCMETATRIEQAERPRAVRP